MLQKIDFDNLKRPTDGEKRFFDILKEKKKAIYDWDGGSICLCSKGAIFALEDSRFWDVSRTVGMTSADMVCLLLYNGIEVNIVKADNLKTREEKEKFIQELRDLIELHKKGE